VQEQWRYVGAQLKKIKVDLASNGEAVSRLDEMLATGVDYRRAIMRDLHNLTSLSANWKEREHRELSELVQARIRFVQVGLLTGPLNDFNNARSGIHA